MLLVLLTGNITWSQTQAVVSVDTAKVLIGDPIVLHITVEDIPMQATVQLPLLSELLKGLEQIEDLGMDTLKKGDLYTINKKIAIAAYDSGTFEIPTLEISVLDKGKHNVLLTDPIAITVRTMEVDTAKPFMPIKSNMEAPIYWYEKWYIWGIIMSVLVAGGIIYYFSKQKTKKFERKERFQLSLHDATIRQLKNLEKKDLMHTGSYKAYYSELIEIMKMYLDRRFQLQTQEQTTAEVLQLAKRIPALKKQRTELKLILRTADLVKFAKGQADDIAMREAMEAAIRLVNQTGEKQEEVPHV